MGKTVLFYTQSDSTTEFSWQNQWRGEMYFSHGSSNSKGCITLIGENVDINIQNNTLDRNGRYIITKCTIQDSVFYLINVYGPNLELEQVKCYTSIVNELSELGVSESDAIIWGGDFNFVFSKLDSDGRNLKLKNNLIGIFEAVKEELGLVDIWRIRNPETKMYTWRSLNPLIQRRLDFFLISSALQPTVICAEIIPTVGTGHSAVSIKIIDIGY